MNLPSHGYSLAAVMLMDRIVHEWLLSVDELVHSWLLVVDSLVRGWLLAVVHGWLSAVY